MPLRVKCIQISQLRRIALRPCACRADFGHQQVRPVADDPIHMLCHQQLHRRYIVHRPRHHQKSSAVHLLYIDSRLFSQQRLLHRRERRYVKRMVRPRMRRCLRHQREEGILQAPTCHHNSNYIAPQSSLHMDIKIRALGEISVSPSRLIWAACSIVILFSECCISPSPLPVVVVDKRAPLSG